eukprot:5940253-Amphidinium_carterae.1
MQRMRIELDQRKAGEAHQTKEIPSPNPIPNKQPDKSVGRVPQIAFPLRGAPHVSVGWRPTLQPVHNKTPGIVYSRKAKKNGGREPPSSDSSSSNESSEKNNSSKSSHDKESEDTDELPFRKGAEVHDIATPRSP